MEKTELLACPFCGKTDSVVLLEQAPSLYYVCCTGQKGRCGARTTLCGRERTAVMSWNLRTPSPDNKPLTVEELREMDGEGGGEAMQSVLISIQPVWVEKILSGEKTVEVRKSKPRLEVPFKCYIYSTQGKSRDLGAIKDSTYQNRQKVVAEFTCDDIYSLAPINHAPQDVDVEKESCLTREGIVKYLGGKGYAWHISDLVVYDKPKELGDFYVERDSTTDCPQLTKLKRPPQSWCYVDGISAWRTNFEK